MSTVPTAHPGRSPIPELFALDGLDTDVWRSRNTDPRGGRMFGGTTLALILAAARASLNVTEMATSSLSVHFLRPADGGATCDFRAKRLYEGASSATREVTVIQDGRPVAMGTATFRAPRETWAHGVRDEPFPHPEHLARTGMPHPARAVPEGAFDIRYYDEREDGVFVRRLWFRATEVLPDSIGIHECAVAFISDLYFFEPVVAQQGLQGNDRSIKYGTTQHSMWFHHPPRADEWLLIESSSPVAAGGRGLVSGEIRTTTGLVVATVFQEVAVRWGSNPGTPRTGDR
jgi:acyl-CoA thioesterase-2